MHYFKVFAILIIVIVLGFSVYLFRTDLLLPEEFVQEKKDIDALLKASVLLKQIFVTGKSDIRWKKKSSICKRELGKEALLDNSFTKCNPNFLQCYFESLDQKAIPHFKVQVDGVKREVNVKKIGERSRYYKDVQQSDLSAFEMSNGSIMMTLVSADYLKKELDIVLEDSCKEVYLPRRIYATGPMKKGVVDILWNNLDSDIFVDRYLVRNLDVLRWQSLIEKKKRVDLKKIDVDNLSAPSVGLNMIERERFCNYWGKTLLSSRVLDAASFHPENYKNPRPVIVKRGPYPWSRKRRSTFLYKVQNETLKDIEKRYCEKVYAKECIELFDQSIIPSTSVTWIGLFNALGGYLESVKNVDNKNLNLKLSSFYFPMRSLVHQIGVRGYWNGEGFSYRDFEFYDYESNILGEKSSVLKVAFRCMRKVGK